MPEWTEIKRIAERAIVEGKKAGIEVCYAYNNPDSPAWVSDAAIHFNGKGNEGHETFVLVRDPEDPAHGMRKFDGEKDWFSFCKTACKPYGDVLVTILHEADKLFPGVIKLSMDGPCHTNLFTNTVVDLEKKEEIKLEYPFTNVDMQELSNLLAGADGHDILDPAFLIKIGFDKKWVADITKTEKAGKHPKEWLFDNEGRRVKSMKGVYALSLIAKLLRDSHTENTSTAMGRGFRFRQEAELFRKGMGDKLPPPQADKPQQPIPPREDKEDTTLVSAL
jgi:hypothetical protein